MKGKEKATDQGDSDDELVDVPSDEGEEEDDGDEEMVDAGQRPSRTRSSQDGTATVTSKRRGGRARSQQLVEAPPSDADEESGAEPDDEQSEDGEEEHQETMAEVVSHLRASKQLRNGKVVALKTAFEDEEEDEDEEMDDADGDTHGEYRWVFTAPRLALNQSPCCRGRHRSRGSHRARFATLPPRRACAGLRGARSARRGHQARSHQAAIRMGALQFALAA